MYISNANPHIFIRELIAAINEGWRIMPTNEGSISQAFVLEIKLFDQERAKIAPYVMDEHKLTISNHDAMSFLLVLQNALLNGYTADESSLVWDSMGIKRIDVENPNHVLAQKYTRDELTEMDWEEFKKICAVYEIKGRQRITMVNLVLNAQEENE